ncbi:GNAT family N-acetyltransferase [Vagococcus sp. BWB3-3]|uniref:GNAT family N-acetyltransferase n=1 Tax=Vagococcus allomyrinae TaxID=2794353 RepID=A0A940P2T9_9ENTE|nr:GNAT family N-acetyltransferase [Vagococcus allomyrinae]MBP1040417.1 GNAT family N-acetyltransferase [Vagococcus allomyrinae]
MNEITLRPFKDEDMPMLAIWLEKQHIRKWYQNPEDWLLEVTERNNTYAWLHHFIVMNEAIAIGFCQYYDCYDARELETWYTVHEPGETFSIDYLIGNEWDIGKGYGKEIVRLLTERIANQEKGQRIVVQPEKENTASNKVLEWNNYVYDDEKKYYVIQL